MWSVSTNQRPAIHTWSTCWAWWRPTAPGGASGALSRESQWWPADHVRLVSGAVVIAQGQEASVRDQRAVGLVPFVRLWCRSLDLSLILASNTKTHREREGSIIIFSQRPKSLCSGRNSKYSVKKRLRMRIWQIWDSQKIQHKYHK